MEQFNLNKADPLKRQPIEGIVGEDLSPMDPPEAFMPPAIDRVSPSEMHPFLRALTEEHAALMEELKIFEDAILAVQKIGFNKELDRKIRHFFHVFEEVFIPHNRIEEAKLFPLLNERLIAKGEHSTSTDPTTAVSLMEDDHLKCIQLAAVILNFLGLVFCLPDDRSRLVVLDAALEQGKGLVELLRLHIFREDNILFASAHKLISTAEFDQIQAVATQNATHMSDHAEEHAHPHSHAPRN